MSSTEFHSKGAFPLMQMCNEERCLEVWTEDQRDSSCSDRWVAWQCVVLWCIGRRIPLWLPLKTPYASLSADGERKMCDQVILWVWASWCNGRVKSCACSDVCLWACVHKHQEWKSLTFATQAPLLRCFLIHLWSTKEEAERERGREWEQDPAAFYRKDPEGFGALKNKANLKVI